MWESIAFRNGEATKVAFADSLDECREKTVKIESSDDFYYFWAGEWPSEKEAIHQLILEEEKANPGKIRRTTIGVKISKDEKALCGCAGRCFCVIEGGRCECQTYYCNANNICRWVPCPGSC
jgi:hypothetical protein